MAEDNQEKTLGWKDVSINTSMGLDTIVNFFNILNQRLCTIENLLAVREEDGKDISLTEYYAREAAKEAAKQESEETTPANK